MKTNSSALPSSALFLIALCCLGTSRAQTPTQTPTGPITAPPNELKSPSAIMQTALNTLQQTLSTLQPDKWKTSTVVRGETSANISSIHRDLETTLPPLLTAADGAPNSVTQILPVFRNTEALYDVLLRVVEAARFSAPTQQYAALEQARVHLEDARHSLGDRLQSAAVARDQQVHTLQATIRTTPPALPPPSPVCPPPPHVTRKRKPRPKPAPKPAQPTTQSGAPATP